MLPKSWHMALFVPKRPVRTRITRMSLRLLFFIVATDFPYIRRFNFNVGFGKSKSSQTIIIRNKLDPKKNFLRIAISLVWLNRSSKFIFSPFPVVALSFFVLASAFSALPFQHFLLLLFRRPRSECLQISRMKNFVEGRQNYFSQYP
jgi:hypothetical protein